MTTTEIRAELPDQPDEQLAKMGLTRAQWELLRVEYREREQRTPAPGTIAPDFALPRLDDRGQTVRLSDYRGKQPVALIFGSYT